MKKFCRARQFLEGTKALEPAIEDEGERYASIDRGITRIRNRRLKKAKHEPAQRTPSSPGREKLG